MAAWAHRDMSRPSSIDSASQGREKNESHEPAARATVRLQGYQQSLHATTHKLNLSLQASRRGAALALNGAVGWATGRRHHTTRLRRVVSYGGPGRLYRSLHMSPFRRARERAATYPRA